MSEKKTEEKSIIPEPLSSYERLQKIDVKIETIPTKTKSGAPGKPLGYVSWVDSYRKILELYPNVEYKIHLFPLILDGVVVQHNYFPYLKTDLGYFVKVSIDLDPVNDGAARRAELYPVMDYKHNCLLIPDVTDINTSIQRAFAKCAARHGLGIHVYAGEDLPPKENDSAPEEQPEEPPPQEGTNANFYITPGQVKLFYARSKAAGFSDKEEFEFFLMEQYKIGGIELIPRDWKNKILEALEGLTEAPK